jgi:putative isomerase
LFLSKIATALGRTNEAKTFLAEHQEMNRRINQSLWNEELGIYCSRLWKAPPDSKSAFLTRITPMNFYPLACGAPDAARAQRLLATLYRQDKFWGEWLLPTLSYDDPDWKLQHYWRGHVWAPPNWIIWQGLKQYAAPVHRAEFARRSVKLFMKNWDVSRIFSENYRSDNGASACHPHYTWGTLLNLIGLEALCDVDEHFAPLPIADGAITENLSLRNIPFGGILFRIEAKDGKVSAIPIGQPKGESATP